MGTKRTLLFLVLGYIIALASEASSIRTGFPYGQYEYLYEAMPGELMVFGVPIWDSLSYTFMTFASLSMAGWLIQTRCDGPGLGSVLRFLSCRAQAQLRNGGQSHSTPVATGSWSLIFLATILTVLLDLLADPLASHGDKWFLGKMYTYAEPGFYFGIPLSNFAGWFFVAFLMIGTFIWIQSWVGEHRASPLLSGTKWKARLGPLLYLSLVFFNLGLTIWIGQYLLAFCGFVIVDLTLLGVYLLSGLPRQN